MNGISGMKERLFSLDLLRGLDMMLLVIAGPVVRAANSVWHFSPGFMRQFDHGWECFTLWDIIMPLFIFMCGAAVPYALGRRLENGKAGPGFWKHVLGRVALLWVLGMMVQGNLLTFDWHKITPYSNTLQSIAAGYLIAACLMLVSSMKIRIGATVAMAAAYTLALAFGGDYSEFGNLAQKVDHAIFKAILPADNPFVAKPSHYTWFLTTLMFGFMTMCGCFASWILRGDGEKKTKAVRLLAYGASLEALGWISAIWIPVIKPIYTLSFTAQAMGWCAIALGALYVLADVLQFRKGLWVVVLFGQCALAAYLAGGWVFRPAMRKLAEVFTQGLPHLFALDKNEMALANAIVSAIALTLILAGWRRCRAKK